MGLLGGIGAALPGAGFGDAAGVKRTAFYAVEQFYLKNGTQPARVHEYLSKGLIPSLKKVHGGPVITLEAVVAAHMPQVLQITGFTSLEEMWKVHEGLSADEDLAARHRAWEDNAEAPYETKTNMLLRAADYSPEIEIQKEPRKSPRIFEMRVYHSPSERQLRALHERFAGPEIKIFHRSGIHPVLYSSAVFGPAMPNLTYLIPFDSLADREKAWAAFGADPDWVKVRAESIAKSGEISSVIHMSLYRATAYSPVQ